MSIAGPMDAKFCDKSVNYVRIMEINNLWTMNIKDSKDLYFFTAYENQKLLVFVTNTDQFQLKKVMK